MKTRLLYILLIAFALFSCNGTKPDEPKIDDTVQVDVSLDKHDFASEVVTVNTPYETYYKPANAVVGDAMPYYNEEDKTFYMYYLLGRFHGYPGGGVYVTKTKDFARFTPVTPTPQILVQANSYDHGIGTGSCIKKDDTYHFFYTGFASKSTATKAIYTGSLAFADWVKKPSLIIEAPENIKSGEFRDPHAYWDDTRNKFVLAVGGVSHNGKAVVVRYQSDDLDNWEAIEPINTAVDSNNPQKFEFPTDSDIPECPDIFKMGNKWYMVFSRINRDEHRKTFYRVADNPDGPWVVAKDANGSHETFDGLWFYAGKTVSDGTNRYAVAWASVGQDKQPNINELIWGGNMITHKLVQQASGKLYPTIPDAVDAKFTDLIQFKDIKQTGNVSGEANSFTLTNGGKVVFNRNSTSSYKIEMKIDASQANKGFGIGFGAYENQQYSYNLTFDLSKSNRYGLESLFMYNVNKELNFTPLIVPNNKQFDVKIVVDKQVCVMYVNGNVAFTNHISSMEKNPWMIFADEGTVKFSDIKIYK